MNSLSTKLRGDSEGQSPRRVLLFRALQLGDLLCAVPMFRALRAALPDAEIVLLGLSWSRQLVERYPDYLDGFREFPGYPGLPERTPALARIPTFLREMQAEQFDLAIQAHGSGSVVNPLTALFGAKQCGGFYVRGEYCPDPERFVPWPETGLEIRRLLCLTQFLGIPPQGENLEFPLRPSDYRSLFGIPEARNLRPGNFVCIHPGASVPERRWPVERFIEVARWLKVQGMRVVLTGTTQELSLTKEIEESLKGTSLNLAGKTELGALAALLHGANMVICNDTGISHLADALRVPSVVISTGNNPDRWAPINNKIHRTLADAKDVGPDEVIKHAKELLRLTDRRTDTSIGASLPAWPEWFTATPRL
jgi:ADP-heptose:LPS heptosyltransferase